MRKLIPLISIVLISTAACKKGNDVEYVVNCDNCEVSYWDKNSEFVARIPSQGEWTYSFEANDDNTLRVSAQSQLCLDATACGDSLALLNDSVYVSIKVDGAVVEEAKVGNSEFATAMVETNL